MTDPTSVPCGKGKSEVGAQRGNLARRVRRLAIYTFAIALLLAMLPTTPAQANDEASRFQTILAQVTAATDAYAAARALSPSDQGLLAKGLLVVRVEAKPAGPKAAVPTSSGKHGLAAPLAGYCPDSLSYYISGIGAFGEVWRYTLYVSWCWDGYTVNSYSYNRFPSNMAPFWNFNGHIGLYQTGGAGYASAYTWTQGSFTLCFPWCGVQNSVPQVWITVDGSGGYSYGAS